MSASYFHHRVIIVTSNNHCDITRVNETEIPNRQLHINLGSLHNRRGRSFRRRPCNPPPNSNQGRPRLQTK